MIRTVLATSLLALAAPAFAQEASAPPSQPETSAPAAEGAGVATQPSARPATEQEVGSLVAGEFPRRDLDSNGSLNQEEFSSWLGELMTRGPGAAGGDPDARIASAFGQADGDGNGSISPSEMIALLSRHH